MYMQLTGNFCEIFIGNGFVVDMGIGNKHCSVKIQHVSR